MSVLAVWAKQIEVPPIAAQIVFLSLLYGWQSASRFLILTSIIGSAITAIFVLVFGLDPLIFNMFILPSRDAWESGLLGIGFRVFDLTLKCLFLTLIILPAVLTILHKPTLDRSDGIGQSRRNLLLQHRWTLLLLVAVFLVPTSVLGRVKFGAWDNSYHSHYYLIAATGLCLSRFGLGYRRHEGAEVTRINTKLAYIAAAVSVCLALPPPDRLRDMPPLDGNPQQQAYEFALAHPGEAYFPWNTLSTLLAEGRLYHFEYNVFDRIRTGYKPTDVHFRLHIPAKVRYVAFHKNRQSEIVMQFLPEFSHRIQLDALPEWIVYTREKPQ